MTSAIRILRIIKEGNGCFCDVSGKRFLLGVFASADTRAYPRAMEQEVVIDVDRSHPDFTAFLAKDGKTPEQFEQELLPLLRAWIDARKDKIARALVCLEGDSLHVVLAPVTKRYDFALSGEASEFVHELSDVYRWQALEALQFSDDEGLEGMRLMSANAAGEARDGG